MFPFSHIQNKSVHFIGIGGIGMSSLAQLFLAKKWVVSGSDISPSEEIITDLKKQGIKVILGHKKGHIRPKLGLVVYNNAILTSNPEFREAKERNLPIVSYPKALGMLTKQYKTVAVAGAHGKSTTTALAALMLVRAGLDPTVVIGTRLKEFKNRNFRMGKSEYLVLEADEFGKSFLNYSPTYVIVTNIDKEHLDTYKNFANVKKTFLQFMGNVQQGGTLVVNKDNAGLWSIRSRITAVAREKHFTVKWYSLSGNKKLSSQIKNKIQIPGMHNVSNALAGSTLASRLGISKEKVLQVIRAYQGSWRRQEYKGKFFDAKVFDDYGHHPTEIKATLRAFKEKYPRSPLICVYQPHQTKRLQLLWRDFLNSFQDADMLVLLPVYEVAGRDAISKKYTSETLAKSLKQKNVYYLSNPKKLPQFLKEFVVNEKKQPIILMMGAGTISNYTRDLVR